MKMASEKKKPEMHSELDTRYAPLLELLVVQFADAPHALVGAAADSGVTALRRVAHHLWM
jgi:hypothetical protein